MNLLKVCILFFIFNFIEQNIILPTTNTAHLFLKVSTLHHIVHEYLSLLTASYSVYPFKNDSKLNNQTVKKGISMAYLIKATTLEWFNFFITISYTNWSDGYRTEFLTNLNVII